MYNIDGENMKEFNFLSSDNETNIHMVMWEPKTEVRLIVQIIHGVTENIMRYEQLAHFLNEKGILVVGIDLLGHGLSTNNDKKKMYFGKEGSWFDVVKDIHICHSIVKKDFPNIPYVMLGFSLGSFLLRTYLIDYPNNCDGAIIIGTGQTPNFQIALAQMVVKNETKKYGDNVVTDQIRKLTFETYNKKFAPNRTPYDWLCSNNEELDKYIDDPLRGESMTVGLFREMLNGMKYTGNLKNVIKMDKNIPILLLSGSQDPVGDFGKGFNKAVSLFNKAGIRSISSILYPDLRHDILHENPHINIYNDIYFWLEKKVSNKNI